MNPPRSSRCPTQQDGQKDRRRRRERRWGRKTGGRLSSRAVNLPCVEACCTICVETINATDHCCKHTAEPWGQHGTAPCYSSRPNESRNRKQQQCGYDGGKFLTAAYADLALGGSFTLACRQKNCLVAQTDLQNICVTLAQRVNLVLYVVIFIILVDWSSLMFKICPSISFWGHKGPFWGLKTKSNSTRVPTLPLQECVVITSQMSELVIMKWLYWSMFFL